MRWRKSCRILYYKLLYRWKVIKVVKLLRIVCISIVFILVGCAKDEVTKDEPPKDFSSIAENGIEKIQPPKGCRIVDIDDDEIPISWEYNRETDDEQNTFQGGCYTDVYDTIYATADTTSIICYYNKNNMSKGLLCGKPDCEHNNPETCNAYVSCIVELKYYNGYLYTVDFGNGGEYKLKKISLDGENREDLGNLITVENPIENSGTISWIIHRGYIYYYYRCGNIYSDDVYYLNNSHCVYRMNLEDKTKECIMVFPSGSDMFECILNGAGSYVYMIMPKNESEGGYLYRFNTETRQLERLESLGKDVSDYAIYNDRLYYLKRTDMERTVELYCFDYESKEKKLIEVIEADSWGMKCDDDYIYVSTWDDRVDTGNVKMYDKTGKHIIDIPVKDTHTSSYNEHIYWGCTDSERIYLYKDIIAASSDDNIWGLMSNGYEELYYFEKSKLLNGEIKMESFN